MRATDCRSDTKQDMMSYVWMSWIMSVDITRLSLQDTEIDYAIIRHKNRHILVRALKATPKGRNVYPE